MSVTYVVKVTVSNLPEWGHSSVEYEKIYTTTNKERAKEILRSRYSTYYLKTDNENVMILSKHYRWEETESRVEIEFSEAEEL